VARERLLDTAVGIFYADGIHAVGVDRIIGAAGVTRATFYRHFPGKEDLVVAYLEREDASIRSTFVAAADAAARAGSGPDQLLDLVIEGLAQDVAQRHTRGCPFINAAAEYPDPTSAVRGRIRTHRDWFRSQLVDLLTADGHPDPSLAAGQLVLIRDAALVGGYLDGWDSIADAFETAARMVIGRASR